MTTLNKNQNKRIIKNAFEKRNVSKFYVQVVTLLLIICVLLAYWFLFFDSNEDLDESTLTKMVAVIYPFAIIIIGLFTNVFNRKSIILITAITVYMIVNYIIFQKGIKSDFITIFIILAFLMARNTIYYSSFIKTVFFVELFLFFAIILTGSYSGVNYISNIFPNMKINANTIAQLIVVNMFIALILTNKKKLTVIHLLIYAVGIVLLYYSASRTAILCGIMLSVGHLLSRKFKTSTVYKLFVIVLMLSVAGLLIYAYVLPMVLPEDFVVFGKSLFTGRQKIYSSALEYIFTSATSALFGYGFISFGQANGVYLNAHNLWLQIWLQYGIFVMLIIFVLFLKVVRTYVIHPTKDSNIYIIYCICLAIMCMLETPLMGRTISVLLLLPLIVGRFCVNEDTTKERQRKKFATGMSMIDKKVVLRGK